MQIHLANLKFSIAFLYYLNAILIYPNKNLKNNTSEVFLFLNAHFFKFSIANYNLVGFSITLFILFSYLRSSFNVFIVSLKMS